MSRTSASGPANSAGRGREGEGLQDRVEAAGQALGQHPAGSSPPPSRSPCRRRRQPRPAAGEQAEQHGERLVVAEHERRQTVPGGEPVPAVAASHGLHRHVEVDQLVHVPPHGPPVHAEPVGELGHRPDAARLQQLQESQHAPCGSRHVSDPNANSGPILSSICPSLRRTALHRPGRTP